MRPRLTKIVNKYKLSGAGAGQMSSEDEDDYGNFDINRCEGGDNYAIFVESNNEVFLLYWWHCLDEEGFFQSTLCILEKF